MSFEDVPQPSGPPSHTTRKTPDFFWSDYSGFAYDLPPMHLMQNGWTEGAREHGGIYQIPQVAIEPNVWKGWTNWIDKFQKDYRFAALSDDNAKANLFPEVQDPWMFTEYVYRGTGRSSDRDDATSVTSSIVEPPLFIPKVTRTFGPDHVTIASSQLTTFNPAYETKMTFEDRVQWGLEYQWKSKAEPFKTYWESELANMNWKEVLTSGDVNESFERLSTTRRSVRLIAPAVNSGVRLYMRPVWAESIRWGQSQNIPARVLSNTGTKEWFTPTERFTSKIVPHINIITGQPIYDVAPQVGDAGTITYSGVIEGNGINTGPRFNPQDRIYLTSITAVGGAGVVDQPYTYTANTGTTADCQLPQRLANPTAEPLLKWRDMRYTDGQVVHRGCAFWEATPATTTSGSFNCSFYQSNSSQWAALGETTYTFSGTGGSMAALAVDTPFRASEVDLEVSHRLVGQAWSNVLSTPQVTLAYHTNASGLVDTVSILYNNANADPYTLFAGVGQLSIRIRRFRKNRPFPEHSKCVFYSGTSDDQKAAYISAGGKCPYFTSQGARVVATYEAEASNGAEWANMRRGLLPGYKQHPWETSLGSILVDFSAGNPMGLGLVNFLGLSIASSIPTPDPYNDGVPKDDFTQVEVTYSPEVVPIKTKEAYYNTPDGLPALGKKDPESDILIRPGTGFQTLDLKQYEPYKGVDSVFYGFVNQINYRIMSNVQHCYKPNKCNPIITLPQTAGRGFKRGRFSNVNFINHELAMPGSPAYNSVSSNAFDYCHYGNHNCPHMNLDRRAVEFRENFKILIDEILIPFRGGGIAAFDSIGMLEKALVNGQVRDIVAEDLYNTYPTAMIVGVVHEQTPSTHPEILGHYQPIVYDASGNRYRLYFYYDIPSYDPSHRSSRVLAHIVQFNDNDNPCYVNTGYIDPSMQAELTTIYGDYAKVPWLVELFEDYEAPNGNVTQITNRHAFAGGRNPEYRDMSKRGRELICQYGGITENPGGNTASNQFGGPAWNRTTYTSVSRRGYWTQKEGEWVVDEFPNSVPGGNAWVEVGPRIQNHPPTIGGQVPIYGVPGFFLENPDQPEFNRSSDYPVVAHTYSNDTPELLDWFKAVHHYVLDDLGNQQPVTNWAMLLPEDPNSTTPGTKIPVAPPGGDKSLLPRSRHMYRCNQCGLRFTEEEVNLLKTLKNEDQSVKYPVPAGVGVVSPPAIMGCPRGDGGYLANTGVFNVIPSTRAKGYVDVWAPPGTTVRHDGYFWKAPTLVNRTHEDQVFQKLGSFNQLGGGYSLGQLTPSVEKMGRLPAQVGNQMLTAKGYMPGLSRQLIAPWAAPNENLTTVRDRVKDIFNLEPSDTIQISRLSTGTKIDVTSGQEATFSLMLGDIIDFFRVIGGVKRKIAITIGAISKAPAAVLADTVVTGDTPKPVAPPSGSTTEELMNYQDKLRSWLLDAVTSSMNFWGSTIHTFPNALKEVLIRRGLSPNLAEGIDPQTGTAIPRDERIISAYGKTEDGGLKMVTMTSMKRMRNRVLPMLAYDLSYPAYTAGGDYTDQAQMSNLNRFQQAPRWLPVRQYGSIPPQVLASSSTGKDYYVEWDKGDVLGSRARAYYPVGTTWWRMNQKVGQIKRNGGTNPLHLDDSTGHSDIPYTGDQITSSCAFFLHGKVPMDKELVSAFLCFTTEDGPYADAIGCQGLYDGFLIPTGLFGNFQPTAQFYMGHPYCFFQHYHPFTTNHENDRGSYPGPIDHGPPPTRYSNPTATYYGYWSKWHTEHHNTDITQDNPALGSPMSDNYETFTAETCASAFQGNSYLSWFSPSPETNYNNRLGLLGLRFVDTSYGFGFTQFILDPTWQYSQNIRQLVTEHAAWKHISYDQYEDLKKRYYVKGKAVINGNQAELDFPYYAKEFRDTYFTNEHQGIPGWMNFSGYGSDKISEFINIEPKIKDASWESGPRAIVQAGAPVAAGGNLSQYIDITTGGHGQHQAGNITRVQDITQQMKALYNDRVPRHYLGTMGWDYAMFFANSLAKTDTNFGNVSRFHEGAKNGWVPSRAWNYRYFRQNAGMWMTDPWHHPSLVNDDYESVASAGDSLSRYADGRIPDVSSWDDQHLTSGDANYLQYHPSSLNLASNDFTNSDWNWASGGASATHNPTPLTNPDRYWQTVSSSDSDQWFTMSLMQLPYETTHRNFRYRAPTIDASNAVCWNAPSCFVAENGWTVGQFYEYAHATFGFNVMPSLQSDVCANCGSHMGSNDGVQYLDGDGIETVSYDNNNVHDAVVKSIEAVMTGGNGPHNGAKHGFVIEYYNSVVAQWRTLFSVDYDVNTGMWSYPLWNGTQWTYPSTTTLPTIYNGEPGHVKDGSLVPSTNQPGANFVIVTAKRIRYRVTDPFKSTHTSGDVAAACSAANKTVTVLASLLTGGVSDYVGRSITLRNTLNSDETTTTIIAASAVSSNFVFTVASAIEDSFNQANINWFSYTSRCTTFRVYGYPYVSGEIMITPPGFVQPLLFREGSTRFRMNSWPTQITRMDCIVGQAKTVPMTMVVPPSGVTDVTQIPNFHWTVESRPIDPTGAIAGNYLRVTGGKWFYDHNNNQIVVPATYLDPTSGQAVSLTTLNEDLYNRRDIKFEKPTRPTMMMVEYFVGAGVPIDVPITALGDGPSYQLEPDSICFYHASAGATQDVANFPIEFAGLQVLPSMDKSVPLKTLQGAQATLDWQVYNHEPVVWNGGVRFMSGNELGPGQWDPNSVMNAFTGNRGFNVYNLGPGSRIWGKATGTVTLYGTPNTILSGKIGVYARAVTERTIRPQGGLPAYVTRERTGGFKSGAFVWNLLISNTIAAGERKGLMAGVPKVLLYFRERNLTEALATQ